MLKLLISPIFILSTILSTLSILSIFVNGLDIELVAMPEKIYIAYRELANHLFKWLFEWWMPFRFPTWLKDTIILWIFCSSTYYKYCKFAGGLRYVKEMWRFVILGPLNFLLAFLMISTEGFSNEYFLFNFFQILILVFYGILIALFLWWNHSEIIALSTNYG